MSRWEILLAVIVGAAACVALFKLPVAYAGGVCWGAIWALWLQFVLGKRA